MGTGGDSLVRYDPTPGVLKLKLLLVGYCFIQMIQKDFV